MKHLSQSPTEPEFVQNPYPFYARARAAGDLFHWEDYGCTTAASHAAVTTILRDRRFGRAPVQPVTVPDHLRDFYALEAHSMLELEPPSHTHLRSRVLRAFTSRRIAEFEAPMRALADDLIDAFPDGNFDLIDHLARPIPVSIIARMIGVPQDRCDDLLDWSNTMVRMYQSHHSRADEDLANQAAVEFSSYLNGLIAEREAAPQDDLLSQLLGEGVLSHAEIISTSVLLLNAGHEATVHSAANGAAILAAQSDRTVNDTVVEEVLRLDPPLHIFNRFAYEEVELFGHRFTRGEEVNCLLASANRDDAIFAHPDAFDPSRFDGANKPAQIASFGGGLHFCVGAPLARMELRVTLERLFERLPTLRIAEPPRYADIYHFHGLEKLMVARG